MARTSSRSATRGRAVQRRSGWLLPLLIVGIVVVIAGALVVQRGGTPTATGAQPIATLNTSDYHALRWSPTDPNTVFFGHHGGMLKSADGGRTWPVARALHPGPAAYSALAATDFRAFHHFAFIGAAGMLLCWLATYPIAGVLGAVLGIGPIAIVLGVVAGAATLAAASLWRPAAA